MLLTVLVAVLALLAGCGGDDDDDTTSVATSPSGGGAPAGGGEQQATPGVYVGQVKGTDSAIALVTDGSRLTGAYLCVPKVVGQWITPAPLKNGKAALVARRGTALGEATFAGGGASGKVDAGGGSHDYSAKPAAGYAGLYRTTTGTANQPGSTETGWIVLPAGSVCGNTNSVTESGGFKSQPAPKTPDGKGRITDFANPFP